MTLQGARIHITGIVQGVGFRPFVYGLATRLSLKGWVRNTSAGVEIEVDGHSEDLKAFVTSLRGDAPPLSRIDSFQVDCLPCYLELMKQSDLTKTLCPCFLQKK